MAKLERSVWNTFNLSINYFDKLRPILNLDFGLLGKD